MTSNNDLNEYFKCVAKVFIATLFAISLIAIACGCATSKKSKDHIVEATEKVNDSVVNGISFDSKWFEKYIQSELSSTENVRITIYDTSLPANIETNKHPISAEIEKTKNVSAHSSGSETSSGESFGDVIISHREDSVGFKVEQREYTEEQRKAIPSWRFYAFVSVVIIAIAIALWGKHIIQDATYWLLNKIFK